MRIVKSNYSNVKETSKGGHVLRLRAETGSSTFIREHMKANGGAKPTREESDAREVWQDLYVYGEAEWLTKLLNKLRHGTPRSLVARVSGKPQTFRPQATVSGELCVAKNDAVATHIDYVDVFDADIRRYVPVKAYLK